MKCKNCETENSQTAIRCSNCNVLLSESMIVDPNASKHNDLSHEEVMCKNCETINSVEALKCSSCNAPLIGSMVILNDKPKMEHPKSEAKHEAHKESVVKSADAKLLDKIVEKAEEDNSILSISNLQKSINETAFKSNEVKTNTICPNCNYPNSEFAINCIACNTNLKPTLSEDKVPTSPTSNPKMDTVTDEVSLQSTINPYMASNLKKCRLIPLLENGQQGNPIVFVGDQIELNRSLLDKNNNTISSQLQAKIQHVDGTWQIIDQSSKQTSFIMIDGKVDIHDGTVLLFGNRLFKFVID